MSTGNDVSNSTFYTPLQSTQSMPELSDAQDQEVMSSESGKGWRWTIRKFFSDRVKPFFTETIPSAFKNFKSLFSRKIEVSESVQTLMTDHTAKMKDLSKAEAKEKKAVAAYERQKQKVEMLEAKLEKEKRIKADRESSKNSTGASKQTLKVAAETTESKLVEAIQTEIRTYQLEEAECKRVAEHKQEEIELLSTRISQIAESLEDAKAKESAAIQMLHKAEADFSEHKAKLEKYQGMIVEINNPDFGTNMAGKPTSEALKLFNEELRVQAKTDTKTKVAKMLQDEVSKGDGLEAEIVRAEAEVTSKSGTRTRFANELAEALTQKGQLEAEVTEKMKFADIAEKQVAKHEAVLKRYQL